MNISYIELRFDNENEELVLKLCKKFNLFLNMSIRAISTVS